jgi:hypothetical protein
MKTFIKVEWPHRYDGCNEWCEVIRLRASSMVDEAQTKTSRLYRQQQHTTNQKEE